MIGIFDSGFGGLYLVRKLRQHSPSLPITYIGDHANLPYGDKSASAIQARALTLTSWLIDQGAQAVLIACNTATAVAIDHLRSRYPVPFIGIEPAVKPASHRSDPLYILATDLTLGSPRLGKLIERFGRHLPIHPLSLPHWVSQVEAGSLPPSRRQLLRDLEAIPAGSQVSLSCTHYLFFAPHIRQLRPDLIIIDPGQSVVSRTLDLYPGQSGSGSLTIYSTAAVPAMAKVASNLLGTPETVKSIQL